MLVRRISVAEYKKVSVKWADHWIDYGDHDIDDVKEYAKKPYEGEYTGYLVADTKRMIAIASNIWDDGGVSDPMYIMKRAIIKLEVLSNESNHHPQEDKSQEKPS